MSQSVRVPQERVIPAQELKQCVVCLRCFTADRVVAHETICEVSAAIVRKPFDITQQIMRGSDAERVIKEKNAFPEEENCQKSKRSGLNTNWRVKHEEFLKKVAEAKQKVANKSKLGEEFPRPSVVDSDMGCVQCQYCLRQYNKVSAARHISICAWRSSKARN